MAEIVGAISARRSNAKLLWILAAAVAAAALAWTAASPYLALSSLGRAMQDADRDKLEALIDFPAVREDLKVQVTTYLAKEMATDPELKDNPFAQFGAALATAFVDKMIDGLVTPVGLAALMEGKTLGDASNASEVKERPKVDLGQFTLRYVNVNTVVVNKSEPDSPSLTMKRQGLFGWRVVRFTVPMDRETEPTAPEPNVPPEVLSAPESSSGPAAAPADQEAPSLAAPSPPAATVPASPPAFDVSTLLSADRTLLARSRRLEDLVENAAVRDPSGTPRRQYQMAISDRNRCRDRACVEAWFAREEDKLSDWEGADELLAQPLR